ncbi:DNA gyrase inhibitor YacG [Quatrionicoccus australiensis]|uniref:DNA gyrase inhibitor YacG n=1 Tax=Quatrionicoccus australiensis TaxID=138118 RepID=UPI001CFA5139|nr:DNA gyrase inhibitor YacG [Quatrionicoccus australiensis]MCB4360524.1 DNA gyrase inhibitor YacG [Quatrionicoccus australiensis]
MTARKVRCPQCGQDALWAPENRWRPFCSERCKQIDLGAWASESYRIPVAVDPEDPALTVPDDDRG